MNESLKMEFQIVLDGKRKWWAIENPNQFPFHSWWVSLRGRTNVKCNNWSIKTKISCILNPSLQAPCSFSRCLKFKAALSGGHLRTVNFNRYQYTNSKITKTVISKGKKEVRNSDILLKILPCYLLRWQLSTLILLTTQ